LARSQSFLSKLLDAGVDVRFCDLPQIEGPTGRFLLQSMMSVAELEAGMIKARTKAALAAPKANGRTLGGRRDQPVGGRALAATVAALHAPFAGGVEDAGVAIDHAVEVQFATVAAIRSVAATARMERTRKAGLHAGDVAQALEALRGASLNNI